ncbi:hypothetical protein [Ferruginibacter sp.]
MKEITPFSLGELIALYEHKFLYKVLSGIFTASINGVLNWEKY